MKISISANSCWSIGTFQRCPCSRYLLRFRNSWHDQGYAWRQTERLFPFLPTSDI